LKKAFFTTEPIPSIALSGNAVNNAQVLPTTTMKIEGTSMKVAMVDPPQRIPITTAANAASNPPSVPISMPFFPCLGAFHTIRKTLGSKPPNSGYRPGEPPLRPILNGAGTKRPNLQQPFF
jgi:hypothetical protein